MTSIESGDVFLYKGLTKQPEDSTVRKVTIVSVSVTGKLAFRIDLDPPLISRTSDGSPSLNGIPYSEALLMVEEGIWVQQ